MSLISREEVSKVAGLAKLNLEEKELDRITKEMAQILEYVKQLEELDVSKIEPTLFAVDLFNVYREDGEGKSLTREESLQNAPQTDGIHFLVPKVIEEEQE